MLKKLLSLALIPLLLLSVSCASFKNNANWAPPAPHPPEAIQVAALHIPRLANEKLAMGHGCPVTDHLMLSAKHVISKEVGGLVVPDPATWDDMTGRVGFIDPILQDNYRDLAMGYSKTPFSGVFRYNTEPLAIGETVYTINFDYNRQKGIVYPNFVIGSIYDGPFAGHLLLSESAGFGASGSCVLNSKGEIVGIYIRFDPNTKKGWAVDLSREELRPPIPEGPFN